MDFGHLFFSLSGRIGRKQFWIALLVLWAASVVLMPLLIALGRSSGWNLSPVSWILMIGVVAAGVKRFHDRGKRAILPILLLVLPAVAVTIYNNNLLWTVMAAPGMAPSSGVSFTLLYVDYGIMLAASCLYLWFIIEGGLLAGTRGANTYGPEPLPPQG